MNKELEEVNKKIEKLEQEQLIPLRHKRNKLKDAEETKGFLNLVGKTFVYRRNCYSCPEKPEDYWDVYKKVTGLSDGGVRILSVQKCAFGNIEIKLEDSYGATFTSSSEPCEESEFEEEYRKLMKELSNDALVSGDEQ